jgi:hypothetical protein
VDCARESVNGKFPDCALGEIIGVAAISRRLEPVVEGIGLGILDVSAGAVDGFGLGE